MQAALGMAWALLLAAQPGQDPGAGQPPPVRSSEEEAVFPRARMFFTDLLARRIPDVVDQSELPFHLEGRKIASRDKLAEEWIRNLADKPLDTVTLYGIEIYTPQMMQNRYGNPPSRLSKLPWRRANTYLAVANLSGRAAIAILHLGLSGWRVVGFTD